MRRILFDANLPPALSRGINELAQGRGIGATCISDLYGSSDIKDEKWISEIDQHNVVGIVSQDYFDKTPQEIAAYQISTVPFFYLAKAYNNLIFGKSAACY
jgi:PIN like domain